MIMAAISGVILIAGVLLVIAHFGVVGGIGITCLALFARGSK